MDVALTILLERSYKGIRYEENPDKSELELKIANQNCEDFIHCIHSINFFTELVGHRNPRSVKLNLEHPNINIYKKLTDFIDKQIIPQIYSYGVLNVLVID